MADTQELHSKKVGCDWVVLALCLIVIVSVMKIPTALLTHAQEVVVVRNQCVNQVGVQKHNMFEQPTVKPGWLCTLRQLLQNITS